MKNVSIRIKVMIPMFLLLIALIASCLVNLKNIDAMMDETTEIIDLDVGSLIQAYNISNSFETLQKLAYAYCEAKEADRPGLQAQIEETMALIDESLEAYQPDEGEVENMENLKALRDKYYNRLYCIWCFNNTYIFLDSKTSCYHFKRSEQYSRCN